ncbi:MAG: 2Fe-2S iron-sulfur cluster-binding protein, partial [Spirochaetaceae bacterium]|nr:2Fe-2S iron-sulfur cluster-binding protein [Spirochaetaceae bacterium]
MIIEVKVNDIAVNIKEGASIIEAAELAGVRIPTLCYHPDVPPSGACGICVVRMPNGRLVRACNTKVKAGTYYRTHDLDINIIRKTILEEILAEHPQDCLGCRRSGSCELQNLAAELNIRGSVLNPAVQENFVDNSSPIVFDTRYCIHCNRCVQICSKVQNVHALELVGAADKSRVRPVDGLTLAEGPCIKCGQCAAHCPVNAIKENEDINELADQLALSRKLMTVQIAPAVRVSLGEAFGLPVGTAVTGKIYAALRRLGFKAIFDTVFGADLTIMEEAQELLKRLDSGEQLPLITTCCPSWVEFMERFHGDMIEHFSSCKSPMIMTGLLTKSYYAEKAGLKAGDIYHVAVMPCTSKKEEKDRPELVHDYKDVDMVITTRELARLIKESGIDFLSLPDEE